MAWVRLNYESLWLMLELLNDWLRKWSALNIAVVTNTWLHKTKHKHNFLITWYLKRMSLFSFILSLFWNKGDKRFLRTWILFILQAEFMNEEAIFFYCINRGVPVVTLLPRSLWLPLGFLFLPAQHLLFTACMIRISRLIKPGIPRWSRRIYAQGRAQCLTSGGKDPGRHS